MEKKLSLIEPYIKFSPVQAAAFSIAPLEKISPIWFLNLYGYFHMCSFDGEDKDSIYTCGLEALTSKLYKYAPCDKFPGLRVNCIDRQLLLNELNVDIVWFCKQMLLKNRGILMFVNVKWIKEYQLDRNYPHPLFVVGFDDEESVFYVKDFFSGVYKECKISYEALKASVENLYDEYFPHADYLQGILLYEKGTYDRFEETDDTSQISWALYHVLSWMLNSDDREMLGGISNKGDLKKVGLNAYNLIIEHLRREIDKFPLGFAHKPLYMLGEHKKVLKIGFEEVYRQNMIGQDLLNEFLVIEEETKKMLFLYLYTYKQGDKSNLNKVIEKVESIREKEFVLYKEVQRRLLDNGLSSR